MRGLRTGLALGFGWRTVFAFVHDVAMAAAAFVLALYLRLGDRLMEQAGPFLAYGTVIFAAVAALVFLLVGLHRGIWRYASMNGLIAILRAVLDRAPMASLVAGRRVLVTGAGGSIGSELVPQIAALGPARLTLVDHSESLLYAIEGEARRGAPGLDIAARIADVRDRPRLDRLVAAERPQLVCHAAALKHVPIAELNPGETLLTNAIGTRNLAEACRKAGVAAMVLISTDKAVNPASILGASKRLAESYCQSLDVAEAARAGGTRFLTVRFGNMLGSTGSVVPRFERQIAEGGPVTVTDPAMTRHFMTAREAVELVLQATALGLKGSWESGGIFVLDMGEPVRILDLAHQMIRLSGKRPDHGIEIVFTGLRPGEKITEEVFHPREIMAATGIPGLLFARPPIADLHYWARNFHALAEAIDSGSDEQLMPLLRRLIPEFDPATPARSATA